MTSSSPLSTLIELAEKMTDEAAASLGRAIRAREELESKLNLLKNYRIDYANKMQNDLQAGKNVQHIRNFQVFISKIDDAIHGQNQLLANAQKKVQLEQQNWQEQEKKRMSYVMLEERALKVQLKKEARRDQIQSDEHGARQFYKQ